MTDRPVEDSRADRPIGLRLFAEAPAEDAVPATAESQQAIVGDVEAEAAPSEVDFDELPDDLRLLGERLTREAEGLARTYPSHSLERLPIGSGASSISARTEIGTACGAEAVDPTTPASKPRSAALHSSRKGIGFGVSAAAAAAAIVGSAIYFSVPDAARPTGQVENAAVEDAARQDSAASVPVRFVNLSLADEGDYRRLEGLLRERSEPEREALFDLLGDERDQATAVRISF